MRRKHPPVSSLTLRLHPPLTHAEQALAFPPSVRHSRRHRPRPRPAPVGFGIQARLTGCGWSLPSCRAWRIARPVGPSPSHPSAVRRLLWPLLTAVPSRPAVPSRARPASRSGPVVIPTLSPWPSGQLPWQPPPPSGSMLTPALSDWPSLRLPSGYRPPVRQRSPDTNLNFPGTPAAFTLSPGPGGLRQLMLTRPRTTPSLRFLFVGSHVCTRASFRHPRAGLPLPSARRYRRLNGHSGTPTRDLHPIRSCPCRAYIQSGGRMVPPGRPPAYAWRCRFR